jgi:hypothetical protein
MCYLLNKQNINLTQMHIGKPVHAPVHFNIYQILHRLRQFSYDQFAY